MSKTIENEKGEEEVVYTEAEINEKVEATKKEIMESSGKTVAEKEARIKELEKISADQKVNFKKYNEMTEAEKAAFDANTVELLKRNDLTATELQEVKTKLAEKEVKERESAKNSVLKSFHGGDEKVKKMVEDNYAYLAGMPETTPEEIAARAGAAARLSGIVIDNRNPLYASFNGEAPKSKDEGKEFVDTDKGKAAADLVRQSLNIKADK